MTASNKLSRAGAASRAYRAGVAVAVVASFLTVWTTIVRDDGNGVGFFMVIMAVAVGWFAAGFRAAGMARTMIGVAVMQGAVGALIATAPIVSKVPGESMRALLFSTFFAGLWLVSGAFFRSAAKCGEAGGHPQPLAARRARITRKVNGA
jgi:hypothetical protein